MAGKTLLTKMALAWGVAAILLTLVWLLATEPPLPPSSTGGLAPPSRVTLPEDFVYQVRTSREVTQFTGVVIHYGGADQVAARSAFDLVLTVQAGQPVFQFGTRWATNPGGGSKEFHLAWVGKRGPRLMAVIVRTLEALLSCLDLGRSCVRMHGELAWAKGCSGPGGSDCLTENLEGNVIRAWIRGSGAGQGESGR